MTDRIEYTPLTPITSDAQVRSAVNNIINNLIPITGQHSIKEHAAVTWLDLLNAGYNLKIGDDGHIIMPSPPEPEKPDMSTPPAIESFSAIAALNYIIFSWQQPAYKNHSHIELWRADGFKGPEDARVPTVLDDAVFRLMAPSIMASDSVLPSDEFRYWARNVSKTGVFGPWTSVDGLLVSVPESPSYLIDKISGEIRESDLFKDLGDKIDGSDKGVKSLQTLTESSYTVKIDSGNAVAGFGIMTSEDGRSDFIIRSDRFAIAAPQQYDQTGKPVISDAAFPFVVDVSNPLEPKSFIKNAYIDKAFIESLVTGSLVSDVITGQLISGAHIRGGDMAIGNNFNVDSAGSLTALNAFIRGTMQSENFGSGTTGWQINNNGNAEFNNAVVRGTIYADDGYFAGTVYADKVVGDVVSAAKFSVSKVTRVGSGGKYYNTDILNINIMTKSNRDRYLVLPVKLFGYFEADNSNGTMQCRCIYNGQTTVVVQHQYSENGTFYPGLALVESAFFLIPKNTSGFLTLNAYMWADNTDRGLPRYSRDASTFLCQVVPVSGTIS